MGQFERRAAWLPVPASVPGLRVDRNARSVRGNAALEQDSPGTAFR